MRPWLLLALLVLPGCLDAPRTPTSPGAAFDEPPAVDPVEPATVSPAGTKPPALDPAKDLRLTEQGFRASEVSFDASFTIHDVVTGPSRDRASEFAWIALLPAERPTTACDKPATTPRFHWLGTPFGNLVGQPVPAGRYVLLLFSMNHGTYDLDLGAAGITEPTPLQTYEPPFGLRVITAEPRTKVVSVSANVEFEQRFRINATALFFSQFTVTANTFQGDQRLESELHVGADSCGGILLERSGGYPSGSWTAPLNRTLPAGDLTWRGHFHARAAANPSGSAYGYLLEWPSP